MNVTLPVARGADLRRSVAATVRPVRRLLVTVIVLDAVATLAGLVGPQVLGRMVDDVTGAHPTVGEVDRAALVFMGALVLQGILTFAARYRGAAVGEQLLASLRESFVRRVVDLPISVVERTDLGDLLTRASTDVERMQQSVRRAAPEITVGLMQTLVFAVALVATAPTLGLPCLVGAVPIFFATRRYRRLAPAAYTDLLAASARDVGYLAESAEAGPTIEALRLGPARVAGSDARIRAWIGTELRALRLRCAYFPVNEVAFYAPVAGVLLLGSVEHQSLGVITTAALYVRQLADPIDTMLNWLDQLQLGTASLARVVGLDTVAPEPETAVLPTGSEVVVDAVRFSYAPGHDVLHDVSITVAEGERIAVVGPSGAGKTTLGRLVAGLTAPTAGSVRIGGAEIGELPSAVRRASVALVTQESHVFTGTLAGNLRLPRPAASDEELESALDAVDALGWVRALPDGLATRVGTDGHPLPPGQVQQLALARLVLADPRVLILDEATSLLDPGAARHLERSLSALMAGRTVIAIAHRLSTAFDADRVAVMEGGRIVELGTHQELLARGGAYAGLWASWHDDHTG